MVQIDHVRASISTLVRSRSLVAVFVGGTSGIGEFTIQALATTHGSRGNRLRVYIVGRNAAAAEGTIAGCRTTCPSGEFIFVKANDLSLLGDVDRVCTEIIGLEEKNVGEEPRIDILVMSQHYFPLLFEPRHGRGSLPSPILCIHSFAIKSPTYNASQTPKKVSMNHCLYFIIRGCASQPNSSLSFSLPPSQPT